MTQQHVAAALYVDLEGVRARYECLACQTVEGPVFGADDVAAFTAEIRVAHRGRCAALQENRS
jgi:hypothetical protein